MATHTDPQAHRQSPRPSLQPYVIKAWQELLSQLHSDVLGLLPVHVAQDVSQHHQGFHTDVPVSVLQPLHDVWQQALHFLCLRERHNFLVLKQRHSTLAKMLWLNTSLPTASQQLAQELLQPPGRGSSQGSKQSLLRQVPFLWGLSVQGRGSAAPTACAKQSSLRWP